MHRTTKTIKIKRFSQEKYKPNDGMTKTEKFSLSLLAIVGETTYCPNLPWTFGVSVKYRSIHLCICPLLTHRAYYNQMNKISFGVRSIEFPWRISHPYFRLQIKVAYCIHVMLTGPSKRVSIRRDEIGHWQRKFATQK